MKVELTSYSIIEELKHRENYIYMGVNFTAVGYVIYIYISFFKKIFALNFILFTNGLYLFIVNYPKSQGLYYIIGTIEMIYLSWIGLVTEAQGVILLFN